MRTYKCDPTLNVGCKKQFCQLVCKKTSRPEFAKNTLVRMFFAMKMAAKGSKIHGALEKKVEESAETFVLAGRTYAEQVNRINDTEMCVVMGKQTDEAAIYFFGMTARKMQVVMPMITQAINEVPDSVVQAGGFNPTAFFGGK